MYSSLKDSGWSYLKEVFYEVQPWSESFSVPERVTWVELMGVPLHCWNHQTFRNIAEVWGELLALGENAFQSFGVGRMSILISTSHLEKINSIIQLEARNDWFQVRVEEIPAPEESFRKATSKMPSKTRHLINKSLRIWNQKIPLSTCLVAPLKSPDEENNKVTPSDSSEAKRPRLN
ncbi:hypothetical protein V6N13_089605 [Hibiscus sabdariffa]